MLSKSSTTFGLVNGPLPPTFALHGLEVSTTRTLMPLVNVSALNAPAHTSQQVLQSTLTAQLTNLVPLASLASTVTIQLSRKALVLLTLPSTLTIKSCA